MKINIIEFRCRVRAPFEIRDTDAGNRLRGALGRSLRGMACKRPNSICTSCGEEKCAYRFLFDSVNTGDSILSGNENIPRPFVLRPALNAPGKYRAGDSFCFEMAIFGKAIAEANSLISAVKNFPAYADNFNLGKLECGSVTAVSPVTRKFRNIISEEDMEMIHDLAFSIDDFPAQNLSSLTLNFVTPVIIKDKGVILQQPTFASVIRRLRDRYSSLCAFYGEGSPDIDFSSYAANAEQVRTTPEGSVFHRERVSRRSGKTQDMSGFSGRLLCEGPVERYLPLLSAGQYFHVGKASVFGYGRYILETGKDTLDR